MGMRRFLLAVSFTLLTPILGGCSSHLIEMGLQDGVGAAGDFEDTSLSVGGRTGISSKGSTGIITTEECDNLPLSRVEVRKDLDDGIVTVLTLGIVNPSTVYFTCDKPKQTSFINCEQIEGTSSPGIPTQITCTRPRNTDQPEPATFECIAESSPAAPDTISSFTCSLEEGAWLDLQRHLRTTPTGRG